MKFLLALSFYGFDLNQFVELVVEKDSGSHCCLLFHFVNLVRLKLTTIISWNQNSAL